MEKIYMPRIEPFVTDEVNFGEFFHSYTNELKDFILFCDKLKCRKAIMKNLLHIDDNKLEELDQICSLATFKPKVDQDELIVPVEGFKNNFNGYKIPRDFNSLASVNWVRARSMEKTAMLKKLRYVGEKDLEEKIVREDSHKSLEDMFSYKEFLITVRVYTPARHKSFTLGGGRNVRLKPMRVSQEFLVPGGATLDLLRDRIICQGDFQSVENDVSDNPWTETTIRVGDVFKSGMFYIGNKFYIDKRDTNCNDYSVPIIEWGKRRKIDFDKKVCKMENTYMCQLNIRLGYPYVFMHLGNCEHLIVFTDARLLQIRDVHVYSYYPIMKSYANLRGKYCHICKRRIAKYIVSESDRLPFMKMYLCAYCLYLYNYIGPSKIGNFKVHKYVDRLAIL